MAKKKNPQPNAASNPVNKQPAQQAAKPNVTKAPVKNAVIAANKQKLSWNELPVATQGILLSCIVIVTWLFLKVCLDNQFTNWDDPGYIKDDAVIKSLSWDGIKSIFSTPIMGNYHPLTILTYAIDYSYKGLDPWRYHLDSLMFHIIDTVLVYFFVQMLTRRPLAAAISALLFALHPMHMESVAWVAGRKDVVYSMFYLAACITWLYFISNAGNKKWMWYAIATLLFTCSLLSKPVAVVLPLTLLLIDYFRKRRLDIWLLIEKLPLFAISAAFGVKSVLDQKNFGSLNTLNIQYNPAERIALGGYALVTYLWKAIVPVRLCNYYPYPDKVNGTLPFYMYIYPVAVAAAIAGLWALIRRSYAKHATPGADANDANIIQGNTIIIFGSLFFLVNIILLLQFIPVGGAIIADRYSYIAYVGLFIIAGWFVSSLFEPGANKQLGYVSLCGTLIYCLYLGVLSNQRCQVWYDTSSLWADEIEKEPTRAPNAYNNLGFSYFNKFNEAVDPADKRRYYDSANYLLNKAIELQPTFVNPYISLGELQRTANDFPDAKRNYYKALSLKSFDEDANAYLGLAIIFAISKNYDSSAYCFKQALHLKPYFPEAVSNYGNLLDIIGQHDSALVQYGIAIAQNPDMYAPYLNRGRALQRLHRCNEAMKDFEKALETSPGLGEIYYAISFCDAQNGNKPKALQDINKAASLGFRGVDKAYYQAMGGR
jgi:Tfp pilus assembly protein PilF